MCSSRSLAPARVESELPLMLTGKVETGFTGTPRVVIMHGSVTELSQTFSPVLLYNPQDGQKQMF